MGCCGSKQKDLIKRFNSTQIIPQTDKSSKIQGVQDHPFSFTCPLNHQLKRVECNNQSQCQKCTQKSMFYFKCHQCSYQVCLSHFWHKQFCNKIEFECCKVGYFRKGDQGRCMICCEKGPIEKIYDYYYKKEMATEVQFTWPGLNCKNCGLKICLKCTTIKHTEIKSTLSLHYLPKNGTKTLCFDCKKDITGGLSCKNCNGSFCQTCQKSYTSLQQEKAIAPSTKVCSICLQSVTEGEIKLACNHSFHGKCLASWNNRTCPNCRSAY